MLLGVIVGKQKHQPLQIIISLSIFLSTCTINWIMLVHNVFQLCDISDVDILHNELNWNSAQKSY